LNDRPAAGRDEVMDGMDDRQLQGFLAGVAAGVVKDLLDCFSYGVLHFTSYRYLDFAAQILYGRKPSFWWDALFAQGIELFFCGLLGVLFVRAMPGATKRNALFKGWFFGVTVWLFLCSLGVIYDVPYFTKTNWQTSNSDFITSSVYGIILALTLCYLERRFPPRPER
jgi:hypothetical protein